MKKRRFSAHRFQTNTGAQQTTRLETHVNFNHSQELNSAICKLSEMTNLACGFFQFQRIFGSASTERFKRFFRSFGKRLLACNVVRWNKSYLFLIVNDLNIKHYRTPQIRNTGPYTNCAYP
jgi:hypothetical protein